MEGGVLLDDSINIDENERPDFADRLVRPLRLRYAVVFLAVASLLLADQAVIQPLLLRLNGYAPVINVAGRQRMLSQKLAKQSLALQFGVGKVPTQVACDQLRQTIEQWSKAHTLLRHGDPARGIRPIASGPIASALADLDRDFEAMRTAASRLAERGADGGYFTILAHEPDYLAGMERVVTMLEAEAQQQVTRLRLGAVVAVVLALVLLASLYAFVVRPATRLIRLQLHMLSRSDARHRALAELLRRSRDELELRVAERTSQLTEANTALTREMGHRRHAETRLRRLSADLAHASRVTALGQLATGLAHELNQPLGSIANYAGTCELLLEREPTASRFLQLRRAIGEVKRSALRAGDIVRRMRNFVKRGADQASLVELNDLVREVAELCEPELRRCGVELTLDLSGDLPAVWADPIQIQQVLVNLVQNAMQALRETAGRRRIAIRTLQVEEGVQVDVTDSGPGFSRDVCRPGRGGSAEEGDPFAPFYTTKADGLGMGLAISRSIIEQHQGRIWADSRPAGGAVVRFYLPSDRAHDTAERTAAHSLCG